MSRPRGDSYRLGPSSDLDISYHIRIALIGDAGIGKTSLLLRYVDEGTGLRSTNPDHSVDVKTKVITRNGRWIKLDIQDTAGMERYRSLTKSHYNTITGALLLFDLTNEKSFQNVLYWYEDLNKYASAPQAVLVGTRCHKKEDCEVSEESIKRLAEHLDIQYVETSSEKNMNVDTCFESLVDKIVEKHSERVKVTSKKPGVRLEDETEPPCCGCWMSSKKEMER
ncbi:ras-related protein Rab-3A-like [Asterias amurensis]|uniref:ras-related protein Rab-3A-like n=1 Tax=Asterias amurensis TaxID=7602 RepID=UPI003AB3E8A3